MQAGESLSFITVPDDLSISEVQSEREKEIVWRTFGTLVQTLMLRFPDALQSLEYPEEHDTVTLSEGSFQVLFADGSYIHLVAYETRDTEGILDLGLSVIEHDSDAKFVCGYLYEMSGEGVRYSKHVELEEEADDEVATSHFSVIDLYKLSYELQNNLFSDDENVRQFAQNEFDYITEKATLGVMERDLGFGWASPTLDDVQKLGAIIELASPFTPPKLLNADDY